MTPSASRRAKVRSFRPSRRTAWARSTGNVGTVGDAWLLCPATRARPHSVEPRAFGPARVGLSQKNLLYATPLLAVLTVVEDAGFATPWTALHCPRPDPRMVPADGCRELWPKFVAK